jgi:hypothetical protein
MKRITPMKRIAIGLGVLVLSAAPALAGGDWDDDDYYDSHYWRGDYRVYHGAPATPYEVYIPYGYYFADEPDVYGPDCKVERKWKRGHYKEKIECDDDD